MKGANKFLKDSHGKTPADIAKENRYFNIENMLTSNGGLSVYCNIK